MNKILLVDDNDGDQKLFEEALSETGLECKLICASEGMDALKKAQEFSPNLIFMDIMLPGISGGDVVKTMKTNNSINSIPVVFLTGVFSDTDENEVGKKINVGGEFYTSISKPIESDKLADIINQYG